MIRIFRIPSGIFELPEELATAAGKFDGPSCPAGEASQYDRNQNRRTQ